MKILIIPDIHGRGFWRKPCEKDWDKIVFLGDYVDPYPGEAEQSDVMGELIDIVEFKRQNPDKVVLLWGNHDCFYWCEPYRRQLDYWSRHDNLRHEDIQAFFRENLDKFQWAYEQDGFLFTHAGVNNSMGKLLIEEYDKLDADVINDFFNKEQNQMLLAMVSYYRGGPDDFSSIIWADVREHYGKMPIDALKKYYQIFGHTYLTSSIVTKWFAMLDTGGDWNYIEDGILKDQNGNELKIEKI
jgi:predicted phosphodiesterase